MVRHLHSKKQEKTKNNACLTFVLLISVNIAIQSIHFTNSSTAYICKERLVSPTHTLAKAKALLQNAKDTYEIALHRTDSPVKQTTDISEIYVSHIKVVSCSNNLPNLHQFPNS